jgi:2-C-methyl-D-erythritol 2,4-cyclodiphosphate synthase
MRFSIGNGYDIHRLNRATASSSDKFFLAGVAIDSPYSILAHSDGDIVIHALADALLGAAALGDIGAHFPDTSAACQGISGSSILTQVMLKVRELGWQFNNADITIVLERPKLATHIEAMRANLSQLLKCSVAQINIKATTNEGLDSIGRRVAIATYAVASLVQD